MCFKTEISSFTRGTLVTDATNPPPPFPVSQGCARPGKVAVWTFLPLLAARHGRGSRDYITSLVAAAVGDPPLGNWVGRHPLPQGKVG
jgi:hypothetical protein